MTNTRTVRLDSLRLRRRDGVSGQPPLYDAFLLFGPRPSHWWKVAFNDHFAGATRWVEWISAARAHLQCGAFDLGAVFDAIAYANESDAQAHAEDVDPRLRAPAAPAKAAPPHPGIELVELCREEFEATFGNGRVRGSKS